MPIDMAENLAGSPDGGDRVVSHSVGVVPDGQGLAVNESTSSPAITSSSQSILTFCVTGIGVFFGVLTGVFAVCFVAVGGLGGGSLHVGLPPSLFVLAGHPLLAIIASMIPCSWATRWIWLPIWIFEWAFYGYVLDRRVGHFRWAEVLGIAVLVPVGVALASVILLPTMGATGPQPGIFLLSLIAAGGNAGFVVVGLHIIASLGASIKNSDA
jgi:hypothetical protein